MLRLVKFVLLGIVLLGAGHYLLAHRADSTIRILTTPLVTIDQLLQNPEKYEGSTVKVEGRVVGSASVLGYGGYRLQQEESQSTIVVLGRSGVPAMGAIVKCVGVFRQAMAVGPYQYAVIVQTL
jgi:hypothetical protein